MTALLIGILVFGGYLLFDRLSAQGRQRSLTRERVYASGFSSSESEDQTLTEEQREKSPLAVKAETVLRGLGVRVDEAQSQLERKLIHAGISSPNAVVTYLFFQRIVAPFIVVIGIMIILRDHDSFTNLLLHLLMGGLCMVAGLFGPKLYVENMIQRRKKKLQLGFPDMLDLLLVCVEAGLALDAALARVCNELGRVHGEVTRELNRTRAELSLINNRTLALQNLANRTDLVAFRYLVAALIQSERFGTSLADTLRVMSDEYRIKRLVLAEEKAARIPVFMTVPLIFCLIPSFMLIILGPAIIAFLESGF